MQTIPLELDNALLTFNLVQFIPKRNNSKSTFSEFGNLYIKMENLENKKLYKI
jgi:hypothetical protein